MLLCPYRKRRSGHSHAEGRPVRTREEVCKPGRSQLCSLLYVGLPASDCEKKNPCHLSACSAVFVTMAPGTNAVRGRWGGPSIRGGVLVERVAPGCCFAVARVVGATLSAFCSRREGVGAGPSVCSLSTCKGGCPDTPSCHRLGLGVVLGGRQGLSHTLAEPRAVTCLPGPLSFTCGAGWP